MKYQYHSHRAQLIQEYISFKRNMGYKYSNEAPFIGMDRFFIEYGATESLGITQAEAEKWCERRSWEKPVTQYSRIMDLRNFSSYLQGFEYESYIPMPIRCIRNFKPYIFSKDEIERILNAAQKLTIWKPHSCRHMLVFYFKLLYATGIRKSEGLLLRIHDVDLAAGTILIRNPKNGKDRILPLSSSLITELKVYAAEYNASSNSEDLFFRKSDEKPISRKTIHSWFVRILTEAKIPYLGGGHGPRVQDLRFTFSVHSLVQMHHKGMDLYYCLPILSQYLGHSSIEATEHYVSLTQEMYPELIQHRNAIDSSVFPEVKYETN